MVLHSLPDPIGNLHAGDHVCFFYQSEAEHRAVLTPFLYEGLERGERVIYIGSSHSSVVAIDYLSRSMPDVPRWLHSGQLMLAEAEQTYLRDGRFNPDAMMALLEHETQRALDDGYPLLRVTGEATWALCGLSTLQQLSMYESRMNDFFSTHKCIGLCQYDRRQFPPKRLLDTLLTHPTVVVTESRCQNPYFMPPAQFFNRADYEATLHRWRQESTALPLPGDPTRNRLRALLAEFSQ